jgi:hypothetical protein
VRLDLRATPQQRAGLLLAGTVTVQCASNPSINGEYSIDQAAQLQITGIASAINAGLGLPGGGDTFLFTGREWNADQFIAYAKGVMNFVYGCLQVVQGHSTDIPSNTLLIP